ncbi:MAG TPA: hypothetical protein V6C97_24935 [Oculatellaceae cyanobacterium]
MTTTKVSPAFLACQKKQLTALSFAVALLLQGNAAFADLRADAAYYYRMWRQTDARAAAAAAGNPFAGLGYVPEIAKWKGLYDKAMAELRKQEREQAKHPAPPEQTAEPANQVPPNRGYGPPRTGLDWQPFLANLRPRAVASSLRQGDDFSSKGDWASALKDYDLASRIDPANQLAKQKAAEARQKLGQQTNQSPTMSNSPTPLRAPDVAQNQMLPQPPTTKTSPTAATGTTPGSLPTVPNTLPGSQNFGNAANAPGFHPSAEQLQKRMQLDDESQQSVRSFFGANSGVLPK